MRERPILFSAPMVRAILAGKKTQTRRVVRWPDWVGEEDRLRLAVQIPAHGLALMSDGRTQRRFTCPYGQPGDQLWVRETWGPCAGGVVYRASEDPAACPDGGKWQPSIFMPLWASRITLEVTGVRVERLHAITEDDAKAEGVEPTMTWETWSAYDPKTQGYPSFFVRPSEGDGYENIRHHPPRELISARASFIGLWRQINGMDSWDANPWVWVVEFKRLEEQLERRAG